MNIEDPRIQLYIDNELSEQEKLDFEKELASFPEVQEYIAFKKFIIEGIQSEGDEELKEYIRTRVQDEGTENQTNLWLYAVATVTVVLISYFFIIQYIKTGSIKEASKVLVLNEPLPNKNKHKNYKLEEVPNVISFDTNQITLDSTNTMALNDMPAEESDAGISDNEEAVMAKPSTSSAPLSSYQWGFGDSRKDINLEKDETLVHQSNLVPIKLALNSPTAGRDDINQPQLAKANRTAFESKSKKEVFKDKSFAVQDTILANSDVKKPSLQIRKFSLFFIQNTFDKPAFDVQYKDGIGMLKLINIDSENPLVYFINDNYYLELGPKMIYLIPSKNTKTISPKTITDKALIKAIQN